MADDPGRRTALDFIVIGASKSGTTSLFRYLREHPRVFIPAIKEAPFFSRDDWYARGWDWYLQEFFGVAPASSLWGTVTPQYLEDAARAAPRIAGRLPEAKLVALLRNPVDRAFSAYRMRVRRGRESRTFEQVVEDQLRAEALAEARRLPWSPKTTDRTYLVTGEYARLLTPFLQQFEPGQTRVMFTEHLAECPETVLETILDSLGLPPGFRPANLGRRYHAGGVRRRSAWAVSLLRSFPGVRQLWRSLNAERRHAILSWYRTEFEVVRSEATLSPALRGTLVEFYRSDVRQLERLLGHEVPWAEFAGDG